MARETVREHPWPHDDVWKDLLERKDLATVSSVLEEYGLLCEADVLRLDETDLGSLSSKLRLLQGNLLRKWVQGLATVGNRGAILSGTPTASETPSGSLTTAAVNSTEPAQEKGDCDRRDKHETELESEGQQEDEDEEEDKEEDEDPTDAEGEQPWKMMRTCSLSVRRA